MSRWLDVHSIHPELELWTTATDGGVEREMRRDTPVLRRTLGLALLSLSCAGARHMADTEPLITDAPAPGSRGTCDCGAAEPLPKHLLERGGVLLFGEFHGNEELPAAFGDAVCATADSGIPIEVGFEMPMADQPHLDAFLASAGTPSDVSALTATPFWTNYPRDGRMSKARVALFERLRRMRAAGFPVSAFAFDLDEKDDMIDRDRRMAEMIASRVRAHPAAFTMVLVGEIHAWKTKGSPWDPSFLPMGWFLAESGLGVRSLGRATPAGTAWFCNSAGECGSAHIGATREILPSGRLKGVELLSQPHPRGYDGLYGTASLTASPPARASK